MDIFIFLKINNIFFVKYVIIIILFIYFFNKLYIGFMGFGIFSCGILGFIGFILGWFSKVKNIVIKYCIYLILVYILL